ncbi:MAG: tRNA (guanosine(37)-N1)-methyltransferase TrmD [Bacilli bacterium]|nr:tRNA (guanosine(37)-N1)-methyltransferase TrmD [Bacilli bacterium]
MKIDILTLFPNMFNGVFEESIIKKAIDNEKVTINIYNFRDYTNDPHNKVDDTPYGGGAGMVLSCQPIFDCVESLKEKDTKVILLTPSGIPYKQKMAYDLSKEKHLIIICGHYEGFDERILSICDLEISIGDYVLTGGEIPAMVLTDSIVRLIPGVINEMSHLEDSFNENYLLDYPTYTKPREYRGMEVPEVLISGDHKKISEWRYNESLKKTKERRPDLLNRGDRNV